MKIKNTTSVFLRLSYFHRIYQAITHAVRVAVSSVCMTLCFVGLVGSPLFACDETPTDAVPSQNNYQLNQLPELIANSDVGCVHLLLKFGDQLTEEQIRDIANLALISRSEQVVYVAVPSICEHAEDPASMFLEALKTGKVKHVELVMSGLSSLGMRGKKGLPWLAEQLKSERFVRRRSACWSLGGMGKTSAVMIPQLMVLAREDEKKSVRHAAIDALGMIGEKTDETIPFLVSIIQHDKELLEPAAEALGRLGSLSTVAVPAIADAYFKSDSTDDAADLVRCLGKIGSEHSRVWDCLKDAMKSKSFFVSSAAADALAAIKSSSSESLLLLSSNLDHENRRVRETCARALGELGVNDIRESMYLEQILANLRLRLKDAEPVVRIEALLAISKLTEEYDHDEHDLIGTIKEMRGDSNFLDIQRGFEVAREMKFAPEVRIPMLLSFLSHSDSTVRLIAISELELMKPLHDDTILTLRKYCKDPSDSVRAAIRRILSNHH